MKSAIGERFSVLTKIFTHSGIRRTSSKWWCNLSLLLFSRSTQSPRGELVFVCNFVFRSLFYAGYPAKSCYESATKVPNVIRSRVVRIASHSLWFLLAEPTRESWRRNWIKENSQLLLGGLPYAVSGSNDRIAISIVNSKIQVPDNPDIHVRKQCVAREKRRSSLKLLLAQKCVRIL